MGNVLNNVDNGVYRKGEFMASSIDFVKYACHQMGEAGEITYKKMFGEYGIYCDGKIVGLICDDQLFIKKTKAGESVFKKAVEGSPYTNAKPHFIIESLDDREFLGEFIRKTYEELPIPKPKKTKI